MKGHNFPHATFAEHLQDSSCMHQRTMLYDNLPLLAQELSLFTATVRLPADHGGNPMGLLQCARKNKSKFEIYFSSVKYLQKNLFNFVLGITFMYFLQFIFAQSEWRFDLGARANSLGKLWAFARFCLVVDLLFHAVDDSWLEQRDSSETL